MTQIVHRANLSYCTFPLRMEEQGRTVIIGDQDSVYYPKPVKDSDLGRRSDYRQTPSLLYCENVLPTDRGCRSVGYTERITGFQAPGQPENLPVHPNFEAVYDMFDPKGLQLWDGTPGNLTYLLAYEKSTRQLFMNIDKANTGNHSIWTIVNPFGFQHIDNSFSLAHVGGKTYFLIGQTQAFVWDSIFCSFNSVALNGLAIGNVFGICESSGYMIAWNQENILWSSTITPTDFSPSLITGAGGGKLQEAKGAILYCKAISGGFLVFCEGNVVAATYSGNSRYPFRFQEIKNAVGFNYTDMLNSDGFLDFNIFERNICQSEYAGAFYIWNNAGIQKMSLNSAETVLPEVSDFIEGDRYVAFDSNNLVFQTVKRTRSETPAVYYPLNARKITNINNRWLVVSYEESPDVSNRDAPNCFNTALVFDVALEKWGKLNLLHTWVFDYSNAFGTTEKNTREKGVNSIAFLKSNGKVVTVDAGSPEGLGIAVFGKFQFRRNNLLDLEQVDIEGIIGQASAEVYDFRTIDGFTFLAAEEGYTDLISGTLRRSLFNLSGLNHSILVKGKFDITSLVLTLTPGGRP